MPVSLKSMLLKGCATATLLAGVSVAANAQTTIYGGGATLPQPTYTQAFTYFNTYVDSSYTFTYAGDGSGAGQKGFLNNDPTQHWTAPLPTTTVDFGASDAFLASNQLSAWASSTLQAGSGKGGQYTGGTSGAATWGGLIQIPTLGTPITLPFNISGKTTNGSVDLTDTDLCGIFSGKITNWGAVSSAPSTGAITVVYRGDNSGTSFLFTQHLAAVCTASNTNTSVLATGAFFATQSFASLFTGGTPPSTFTAATGSGGVQAKLAGSAAVSGAVGYLSPDYTKIAPISAGRPSYPAVASVNGILPTVANTLAALGTATPPSNTATPPSSIVPATNPDNWVPRVPAPSAGYPIVGYTTWEVAQCYSSASVAAGITEFLNTWYNDSNIGAIANNNGFITVPASFAAAITTDFLGSSSLNLDIQNTTVCGSLAGR